MKRALWVTAVEPSYEGGGGSIRQAYLLDALSQRFETHLLLAGSLRDERLRRRLASLREAPVPPRPDPRRRLRRRLRHIRDAFVQRQPVEVAEQRGVRRALEPLLHGAPQADLVCVEYIGLAPLLHTHRSNFWALTLHNLTSGMAAQAASVAPGRRHRLLLAAEERHSSRVERWAVGAYDLVVAASEDDAGRLGRGVVVVPNGVDTDRFQPSPVEQAARVVFTGALHTMPNLDGIQWFCREVWPRIRHRMPGCTLEIVGARPLPEVLALAGLEGVTVHPDVPSVLPFLRRSRVAVVPLRIGTGSRIKALEAMASARPVVGTAVGMGGLAVQPGRDVLVADDPAGFAEAVVDCLSDLELAQRLGRNGRELVETRYAWSHIGAAYASLLFDRVGAHAS